ncbi:MAG: cell division protein FtsQ/DivIB [Deltaproteobacteria bacterium]
MSADAEAPAADHPGASRVGLRTRVALIGIAGLLVVSSPLWAPLLMRRMSFFRVRRIEILGARYAAPSDILARMHVDTSASVWDPTGPLAKRVAASPAIQHVEVRRKLPGTLVVEVSERPPIALVPASGGFKVYDDRGVVLPIDPSRIPVDLPVAAERDVPLFRLLSQMRIGLPLLYARVSAARRVNGNELLLELKNGVVRTMEDVTLDRLADLEPVEADLGRKQLHAAEIDLRYRDQVIARLQ